MLNRVVEPIGENVFPKYQTHRQPDQQSYDESAHNRSARNKPATQAGARSSHLIPVNGKIMVQGQLGAKRMDAELAIPGPGVYCSGTFLGLKRLQKPG